MIVGRITAKAQTTVPIAVRRALGIEPGDDVAWEIEDGRAVLTKMVAVPFVADLGSFTEWADELDAAYDAL
ncbi:AbrB/MazE/SpoVT family DNA-binding domain-containing protein [Sphingomonas rubra]|uniref:PrlF antitoxin for toxin YhaV_toxin n=1 Tax=Sphingomonas rubra TaxID=634430 RepID=A0A1I5T6B5_9SPHN|nr:type II toxin-antitoxin system PrlF family antitoxin [Sphingomonas rubra]SFP78197.1 prlF antitoxin for toxin YhaV_toxin [Sphingomonas rubra]